MVVNKHGDCKSPKDRVVGPLPNGGDPITTYVRPGMILQVGSHKEKASKVIQLLYMFVCMVVLHSLKLTVRT